MPTEVGRWPGRDAPPPRMARPTDGLRLSAHQKGPTLSSVGHCPLTSLPSPSFSSHLLPTTLPSPQAQAPEGQLANTWPATRRKMAKTHTRSCLPSQPQCIPSPSARLRMFQGITQGQPGAEYRQGSHLQTSVLDAFRNISAGGRKGGKGEHMK